jgi:catabolite regulation protein CreA
VITESMKDCVVGIIGIAVEIGKLSVVASTVLGALEVVRDPEIASVCAYRVSRISAGAYRRLRR